MLKKARLLTRPTPALQDAPFPGQGRNSETDPSFHVSRLTFNGFLERCENAAGGLFQHTAKLLAADWWCFRSPATFFLTHRAGRITVPKILAPACSLGRLIFPQRL